VSEPIPPGPRTPATDGSRRDPDDWFAPMLATPGPVPDGRRGWAFEFKWDGIRAIAQVRNGSVRATSRNRNDLLARFPELAELAEAFVGRAVILDGEIIAPDAHGRPDFGLLQHRLPDPGSGSRRASVGVSYLVFDLLYLDGIWLADAPWDARRDALEDLGLHAPHVAVPPAFRNADGAAVLAAGRARGLEGVVAKRRSAPYRAGARSPDWVKIKSSRTQEVIVGGWTEGRGALVGSLGALLVGVPGPDGLDYVGKVGTGFGDASRLEILGRLRSLERSSSPFSRRLPSAVHAAQFVAPRLVGEVRFTEWTAAGRLRHPSWRGWRPDKHPHEVRHEP
jgi:bifunctional non-homologous end joining protein LigD